MFLLRPRNGIWYRPQLFLHFYEVKMRLIRWKVFWISSYLRKSSFLCCSHIYFSHIEMELCVRTNFLSVTMSIQVLQVSWRRHAVLFRFLCDGSAIFVRDGLFPRSANVTEVKKSPMYTPNLHIVSHSVSSDACRLD